MKKQNAESYWDDQTHLWRDPEKVAVQWMRSEPLDPVILKYREYGDFFEILEDLKVTLLITREYEHLVMGITMVKGMPIVSYLSLPHPSGLVADLKREVVYIASTRNPNMVFEFSPAKKIISRLEYPKSEREEIHNRVLLPRSSRYLAGCYYIHDLSIIDGSLYANSVGQNSVIKFNDDDAKIVWWPKCIDHGKEPLIEKNYIQLNSIAGGKSLSSSFFSASTDKISFRRPGHRNFPVDRRGVIFSGKTREPIVYGLTRPHSARLYKNKLYVDNSGYGELILANDEKPTVISKFNGWTRGLGFFNNFAFVGTSRVIPHYRQYAPGVDVDKARCGIHILEINTGKVIASLIWPFGNQIFAIEPVPQEITLGFPSIVGRRNSIIEARRLYYTFS